MSDDLLGTPLGPEVNNYRIPPIQDAEKYQFFIRDLMNYDDKTDSYQVFGSKGQCQDGVDVVSFENKTAVQCKVRNNKPSIQETNGIIKELNKDFEEFYKKFIEGKKMSFDRFIFASTYREDTRIQLRIAELNRNQKNVRLEYWHHNFTLEKISRKIYENYYRIFLEESQIDKENEPHFEERMHFNDELYVEVKFDSIIGELHYKLNQKFKQVNILPFNLLIDGMPFSQKGKMPYKVSSVLTADNPEFLSFLDNLDVSKKRSLKFKNPKLVEHIDNALTKTKQILNKLTAHNIYWVDDLVNNKRYKTAYFQNEECNCTQCRLNRFEFSHIPAQLTGRKKKLEEKIKEAHINYRLKNYESAIRQFIRIKIQAETEKKYTYAFIAAYNLNRLKHFCNVFYIDGADKKVADLRKSIAEIDLQELLCNQKDEKDFGIKNHILQQKFYSYAFHQISDLVREIKNDFDNSHEGGWASSNRASELIFAFSYLEKFVNHNYITHSIDHIADLFIEGVFAAHGTHLRSGSRLESFEDWTLNKLIIYGNASSILKYASKYNVVEIGYSPDFNRVDNFLSLSERLFSTYSIDNSGKTLNRNGDDFKEMLRTYFENILAVASLLKLSKQQVVDFTNWLIDFLGKQNVFFLNNNKVFDAFLIEKGHKVEALQLKKLWNLLLYKDDVISKTRDTFSVFGKLFRDRNISISKKDFKHICSTVGKKDDPSTILISRRLAEIWPIAKRFNSEQKITFEKMIMDVLDIRFDFNLCYDLTIHDIIGFNQKHFDNLLSSAIAQSSFDHQNSFFGQSDINKIHAVDDVINLCLKENVNLKEERFLPLKKVDKYYEWLLDIDGFNYKHFKPYWIMEFASKYYFKYFKSSTILKSHLEYYLNNTANEKISKFYFLIYVKQD